MMQNPNVNLLLLVLLGTVISTESCQWKKHASPPARWMSGAAASGAEAVFFAGGTLVDEDGRPGPESGEVYSYNPSQKTWRQLPNMTARTAPAAAVYDGRLYVFGGSAKKKNASRSDPDPTIKFSLVESIAVNTFGEALEDSWRKENDMPFGPRESPSAAVDPSPDGGGIIIAGGFFSATVKGVFEFEYFNSTYLYNPSKGKYEQLDDMPFARSNMALVSVAVNDSEHAVYAFGGGKTNPSYATCAVLRKDAGIRAWSSCPTLIDPRSWAAAGSVGKGIILAGGMNGQFAPTNEVDTLTVGSSTWEQVSCNLPVRAGFLSGAVTTEDERFIVVAGDSPQNGVYEFIP
eukprot:g3529.t1